MKDPIVTYRLTHRDRELLRSGLARLALLMLEAGAEEVFPSFRGAPAVRNRRDVATMQHAFSAAKATRHDRAPVQHGAHGRGPRALRRRLVRPGARVPKHVRQRCLAAAHGTGRQSPGVGDGIRHPQRPPFRRHRRIPCLTPRPLGRPSNDGPRPAPRWSPAPTAGSGRALAASPAGRPGPRPRCACSRTVPPRPRRCGRSWATATGVDIVIGDIARADTAARLLHGLDASTDVLHTAGDHPPEAGAPVHRGEHQRHAAHHRGRHRRRRPPTGARVVEQSVRHEPSPGRHVPRRRAVQPVPGLRQEQDVRRDGRHRSRGGRARRRHRSPALVLRPVPAATADHVLPHGPGGQVPGHRQGRPASFDGLRRQPRRWRPRRRAHACRPRQGLLDRRRPRLHRRTRSSRPWAGRWSTKASA